MSNWHYTSKKTIILDGKEREYLVYDINDWEYLLYNFDFAFINHALDEHEYLADTACYVHRPENDEELIYVPTKKTFTDIGGYKEMMETREWIKNLVEDDSY